MGVVNMGVIYWCGYKEDKYTSRYIRVEYTDLVWVQGG
jgi:hypothetical protein